VNIVTDEKNTLREFQKLNKSTDSKLFLYNLMAALQLIKPTMSATFKCEYATLAMPQ